MANQPIIFHRGKLFIVELAQQENGKSKVLDFLNKKLDKRQRIKIGTFIQRYADEGKISNDQQFKKLKGKTRLYEFKNFQVRILMYHHSPGRIVLTHGFIKKDDDTPQSQIDRGERIAEEYDLMRKDFKNGGKNHL